MGKSTAVQGTNDSSSVSKFSMVNKGYFQDDFIKYFTIKTQQRSPLINRGYYIRAKAIDAVFTHFFTSFVDQHSSHASCQVLSFGAGFDSTYFRLKSKGCLPSNCKYFEIDFLEVAKKKAAIINQNIQLQNLCGESKSPSDSNTVFAGVNYCLLGANLEDVAYLQKLLEANGVTYKIPTLALSECVLVYMDVNRSDQLIQWVGKNFCSAMFITYEQVYPNDGFGIIMQNHFLSIGSPLKSLRSYHSLEDQKQRYLKKGWPLCFAVGMNDFYYSLPPDEQMRIQSLEMFDEFEEWHLKCSHYVMICAAHNSCLNFVLPLYKASSIKVDIPLKLEDFPQNVEVQFISTDGFSERFGHQSVLTPSGQLITCGGFGKQRGKHKRIDGFVMSDITGKSNTCLLWDDEQLLGARVHHTLTLLASDHLLVIGGRSSPAKPYEGVIQFHPVRSNQDVNNLAEGIKMENKLQCCKVDDIKGSFIPAPLSDVGSSSGSNDLLVDCFMSENDCKSEKCSLQPYNFSNLQCKEEEKIIGYFCTRVTASGSLPCPRWRHTATVVKNKGVENIVLFGGHSLTAEAMNDCYVFDTRLQTWTEITLQPDTPCARHTHSAVSWDFHSVIITGGLGKREHPLNTVHKFEMSTRSWVKFLVSGLLPRYSHTSHIWKEKLVLLGGVNTFHNAMPGVAVIDLLTLQAVEYNLPLQSPDHPFLCHNHCSVLLKDREMVLLVGGGGNCFSFGTHMNRSLLFIPLENLL